MKSWNQKKRIHLKRRLAAAFSIIVLAAAVPAGTIFAETLSAETSESTAAYTAAETEYPAEGQIMSLKHQRIQPVMLREKRNFQRRQMLPKQQRTLKQRRQQMLSKQQQLLKQRKQQTLSKQQQTLKQRKQQTLSKQQQTLKQRKQQMLSK